MRLIDSYSAKEALEYTLAGDSASMAERVIDSQPTVEAVPVVRCRECTEFDETEHECSHWYGFRENDFCSYGKRKEGADNEP